MDFEQFQKFNTGEGQASGLVQITAEAFTTNHEDRTLIYGYSVTGQSVHVYLKGGNVYLAEYYTNEHPDKLVPQDQVINKFTSLDELIPNKRAYPETCDYDFCMWLKDQGVMPTFTTFNKLREKKKFYGFVHE